MLNSNTIHPGKEYLETLFNKWCWDNCITTQKRLKLYPSLTPYIKINSKWIKDLNVRAETIKLLQDMGLNLLDHGILDIMPKVQETKEKDCTSSKF